MTLPKRSIEPAIGGSRLRRAAGRLAATLSAWAARAPGRAVDAAAAAEASHPLARRDALTGLHNRDGLRAGLERALAPGAAPARGGLGLGLGLGLLIVDIDRFRVINESLGQPLGDALLRSVAARMRAVAGAGAVIARLNADQFAIVAQHAPGTDALALLARNLLRAFEGPLVVGARDAAVGLSIGIAAAGEHAANADELLQNAELAMRAAKAEGGARWRRFDALMRDGHANPLELEMRLRQALKNGGFRLAFQPVFDAAGTRVVCVESLLRWNDPQRGLVMPGEFIATLEQTGLIVAVGQWVLRESCRQALGWIVGGARAAVLSVNVSPRQFAEADFVASVAAILDETGFPARRLQLEVTEGLLLDPTPATLAKLAALVAMGARFAVDDFGMGYSSLAYLKRFPLATLKVDRMFVRDLLDDPRDRAIVRAIVELGHGLGLNVTAEGVETSEQFEALRELGCDSLQGYLFSRPVPAAAIGDLLAAAGSADADDAAISGWSSTMAAMQLEVEPRVFGFETPLPRS